MTPNSKIFRFVVVIALAVTNFFAIPGIFYPIAAAEKLGAATPNEAVWAAFGFLLTFLVSLFSIPVVLDVGRYRFNAFIGIVGHFVMFFYWFIVYPYQTHESVPWIAWFELLVAVAEAILLSRVLTELIANPSLDGNPR